MEEFDKDILATDLVEPLVHYREQDDLYQKREKIYTRKVSGFYQQLRFYTGWPLLVGYFILPWISFGNRQSVLFDLPERKFYIFNLTFWPQDFYFLAWALIISALALFFFTTWLGRIWCGYSCPQTVWTSIFMWVEQLAEGTRNQRIRLDKAPMSWNKFIRRFCKHSMWIGFSLLTAITFVGYFTPMRQLFLALMDFSAGSWSVFWIAFFTIMTYLNAGWLREQICIYMCPYARFQSAMFDDNTLIVSYDKQRGEPRGSRKQHSDYKARGLGDCIDCQLCIQVCPTGIDIRNGLQYQCIGCALCIDACDQVMNKMHYPTKLIRYTTKNQLNAKTDNSFNYRLLGYGGFLVIMVLLFNYALLTRIPLAVDVIRDRNQLYQETEEGMVENNYTLKVMNMDNQDHFYAVLVLGIKGLTIMNKTELHVQTGEIASLPLRLRLDPGNLTTRSQKITFMLIAYDNPDIIARHESRFIGPQSYLHDRRYN